MMKALHWLSIVFVILLFPVAEAQTGSQAASVQTPPYSYEAVTIKPNNSGKDGVRISADYSTYKATNISLARLLFDAYGIRPSLISGIPGWADSARFDINAKIVDYDPDAIKKLTREQRDAMMAAMLVERFHLKAHKEIKQLPVFELVVAKDAPKFKVNPAPPPGSDPDPPKGTLRRGDMSSNGSNGVVSLTGTAVHLSNLAEFLERQLDRTVIDKTGLTGEYDLHLKWTTDNAPQPLPDDAPPVLFTALSEQLGLKLQPGKGPVETLVVDHVEQPTGN